MRRLGFKMPGVSASKSEEDLRREAEEIFAAHLKKGIIQGIA